MAETAGRLIITRELLVQVLGLPEGTEITAVFDDALYHRAISVAICGPGLPLREEGDLLPAVKAVVERTATGLRFIEYKPIL